jgi:hypothetical protein
VHRSVCGYDCVVHWCVHGTVVSVLPCVLLCEPRGQMFSCVLCVGQKKNSCVRWCVKELNNAIPWVCEKLVCALVCAPCIHFALHTVCHSLDARDRAMDMITQSHTALTTTVWPESTRIALGWVWGVRDCLHRTSAYVLSVDSFCHVFVLFRKAFIKRIHTMFATGATVAVGSSPPERAVAGTMHRVTLPSGRAVVHLQLPMPPRITKVVTVLADSIVTFTALAQPSK